MVEKLKNKDYDLISVIYNASQATETCSQYIKDAEKERDPEVKQFFNEVLETNSHLVQRGKQLLKDRLQ